MFKRIALFFLTNIFVMITINIILNLFGVRHYITASGIDYSALMIFCLVWGMAGSLISLMLSKFMAKMMTGMIMIDPKNPGEYRWLVDMVHGFARKAQLPKMPDVGVYPSYEVNAFATGPSKSNSLVAVSEGLLRSMSVEEIEGVIGHEVAHIQNGDMVTMTLIQGVVNAFTMFISRIIAFAVSQQVEEEKRYWVHMLVQLFLDIALGFLGYMVVCWFSRQREFRADRGSAKLTGSSGKMIAALKRLGSLHGIGNDEQSATNTAIASLKISGKTSKLMALFSTHPPIEARVRALSVGV